MNDHELIIERLQEAWAKAMREIPADRIRIRDFDPSPHMMAWYWPEGVPPPIDTATNRFWNNKADE